jgi:hypothetical protein
MKTANFIYQYNRNGDRVQNVYGTVTLKNDGKVSISIHNGDGYSYVAKYQAKVCAKAIVAADFRHPAVQGTIYEQDKSLVNVLLEKTTELHVAYINYTKKWSVKSFVYMGKFLEKTEEEQFDQYSVKWEYKSYGVNKPFPYPISNDNRSMKNYNRLRNDLDKYRRIREEGFKKYMDGEVKDANRHYNDSICKLSDRLMKKGVDVKKMTIKTAQVGINIEITIECNGVITRAWTIVAEGEIQRAHYRYLVK